MNNDVDDDVQEVGDAVAPGAAEGGGDQTKRRCEAVAAQQYRAAQACEAGKHQRVRQAAGHGARMVLLCCLAVGLRVACRVMPACYGRKEEPSPICDRSDF